MFTTFLGPLFIKGSQLKEEFLFLNKSLVDATGSQDTKDTFDIVPEQVFANLKTKIPFVLHNIKTRRLFLSMTTYRHRILYENDNATDSRASQGRVVETRIQRILSTYLMHAHN